MEHTHGAFENYSELLKLLAAEFVEGNRMTSECYDEPTNELAGICILDLPLMTYIIGRPRGDSWSSLEAKAGKTIFGHGLCCS